MFRQAIVTKFIAPTNHRGARVSAKADAGSIVVQWDHALNVERNHAAAAETLARKYGWAGAWVGGSTPGAGFAFVAADDLSAAFTVAEQS